MMLYPSVPNVESITQKSRLSPAMNSATSRQHLGAAQTLSVQQDYRPLKKRAPVKINFKQIANWNNDFIDYPGFEHPAPASGNADRRREAYESAAAGTVDSTEAGG